MCNSGLFTEKHVFQNCIYFQEQREALIDRVKNVKPDIIINSIFYKFGNNTRTNNAKDFFITKSVHDYVIYVWTNVKKPRIA